MDLEDRLDWFTKCLIEAAFRKAANDLGESVPKFFIRDNQLELQVEFVSEYNPLSSVFMKKEGAVSKQLNGATYYASRQIAMFYIRKAKAVRAS